PSDKGGHLYAPPPKLAQLCEPLSPMVFNDLFCLSHPQVHTLSLGASRPTDFDEHLKVLPLLDRAKELLPPILQRLEAAAIAALGEDWYRSWHVGLPTPERTPDGINLRTILWLRNLAIAYDMVDYAKARYNMLGRASHWFPGAQAENAARYDFASCLAASPHAQKIPALLADAHARLVGEAGSRLSQS
ncbi:MAG: aldo/keto reductase, partial [Cyanobacteria bacterium J06641_5]